MLSLLKPRVKTLQLARFFSEVTRQESQASLTDMEKEREQLEGFRNVLQMSKQDFEESHKINADLVLNRESMQAVENAGMYYKDINQAMDAEKHAVRDWRLTYLKNMLLLQDYNNLFREFLQSVCRDDHHGFNLILENDFNEYFQSNLIPVQRKGYNLVMESLKVFQEYKVLRIELYKNLKLQRSENEPYNSYDFSKRWTPLAPLVVANEKSPETDRVIVDTKPFILATTMLIKTPMKVGVFNQNLKRKLYGLPEDEWMEYVVRFESEFSLEDLFWVLPTQNKPNRLRTTRITDFNNMMRGNPYFQSKSDLVDEQLRYRYMPENKQADMRVRAFKSQLDLSRF